MTTCAVIGLGAMGSRIANRLLEDGRPVVVWNRSPEPIEHLVAAGATTAATPASAAERADLVITMVSDDQALRSVTEGPQGVASGIGAGFLVQMSTVSPGAISRLARVLPRAASLIDAPVLGSIAEAESGRLTIFVGEDAASDATQAMLSTLGTVRRMGGIGAGTAAKLVANSTLFGVLGVLGEAVALADGLGLDRAAAMNVLAATPLASQAERREPVISGAAVPTRFALAHAAKDAELISEAAGHAGTRLLVAEAVRTWLYDALRAGSGQEDYTSVMRHIIGAVPGP